MSDKKLFRLGATILSVEGSCPEAELVKDELSRCSVNAESEPELEFIISDDAVPPPDEPTVGISLVRAGKNAAWLDYSAHGFKLKVVTSEDNRRLKVYAQPVRAQHRLPMPAIYRRLRDWSFLTPEEKRAYAFINIIIEPFLLFNAKNSTLLHASAIEKNGKAFVFPSTGGVGKTALSFLMIKKHGYRLLADDYCHVSTAGKVYFHPRKIMFYGYNLQGLPEERKEFLRNRPFLDRLHWQLKEKRHAGRGVRRRLSVEEIYGQPAESARVEKVFFLVRHSMADFRVEPVKPEKLAETCANILLLEYGSVMKPILSWIITGRAPLSFLEIFERSKSIYRQFFQHVGELSVVNIPDRAAPDDLLNFFKPLLEE